MRILIVSADRTVASGVPANLGDAFLTDALAESLVAAGNRVEVVDFGSSRSAGWFPRVRADGMRGLVGAIARNDAVIIGGGTLIQDDRPDRVVGGLSRLCAVTSVVARALRRPVRYFGVGCDSIDRRAPRLLYRLAVRGSRVWVREVDSRDRFLRMFAVEPGISSDVALLMTATVKEAPESDEIVLAMNRSEGPQVASDVIDLLSRQGTPSFLSMDQQEDSADYMSVPEHVRAQMNHSPERLGWEDAWRRIGGSKMLLASRMHALYMAAMLGVPMVAVGDREKVVSFAEEFRVPLIPTLAAYVPGMERPADTASLDEAVNRARRSLAEMLATL